MTRIIGYLLLLIPAGFWLMYAVNTEVIRYRMTVEVQTPGGMRSGSSVIEVRYVNEAFVPGFPGGVQKAYVRGEAVVIEIGEGKTLFALLTSGLRGEGVDWVRYVRHNTQPKHAHPVAGQTGVLTAPNRPTMVTFSDLTNPASAKVVFADASQGNSVDNMAVAFGPGHALGAVTTTYVDPGRRITQIWPLNLLPFTSPQWLFGEPVTRGIEEKLAGLHDTEKWNAQLRALPWDVNRIRIGSHSIKRNF
jgi:hypothetical protein